MEIVIEMSEEKYEWIKENNPKADKNSIIGAIVYGTPLPKGHGRLKDIGKCNRKLFYKQCGGANSLITVKNAFDMLLSLPTIIEADKAESEKNNGN